MAPLLEGAAMEEEESLQNKWAALLSNTVSENSQINTNLFSHILSQLTKEEADFFDFLYKNGTDTQSGNGVTMTVKKNTIFNLDNLRAINKHSDIIIDNLVRLRLMKEVQAHSVNTEFVTLTDLGFQFMAACRTYS